MNEEEKEIIERIQQDSTFRERKLLRIINKQKEEIEYYKSQKRYDDQFKHELLEEIRCKGLTIDSLNKILDDRLICIQGGRGLYSKLKGLDKEYLIREYLSMYKMCKQEIEEKDKSLKLHTKLEYQYKNDYLNVIEDLKKKDKIINLMAEWISNICFYKDDYGNSCEIIQDSCYKDSDCKQCIKQYFENKAEEEK